MVLTSSVVSHVWLLVKDLDAAIRFFGDVLGFRLLEARPHAARFDANNLTIGLFQAEDDEAPSPIVTFRMEYGMEGFHAFLREKGVKTKAMDMDFIGKVLAIEDPDGHVFWIHQPSGE